MSIHNKFDSLADKGDKDFYAIVTDILLTREMFIIMRLHNVHLSSCFSWAKH